MERQLREHFEWAVGDDPGVAAGELARAAIAEGGRLRRRRMTVAGVAAGLVVVTGLGVSLAARTTDSPVTVAAAMMPVPALSCTARPVETDATDVVVFLDPATATAEQVAALRTALDGDPRVQTAIFEDRAQAYQRFRTRWKKNPDLLQAVGAQQLPESFRLRLVDASQYTAVRTTYATMSGVDQIVGRRCSKDAPVGGVQ